MPPHIRALVAASAYCAITGKTVAGLYDHAAGRHLRIAAEHRDGRIQGVDGDRSARFGGTLPELFDEGQRSFVSLELDGTTARGYDRASASFYTAHVNGRVVQLYDHLMGSWFAYDVQSPDGGEQG